MPEPAVEFENLAKVYEMGAERVHALRGVSARFEEGSFWAIMGASGSGKSTLLSILGCLDRPTSGTYRLGGEDVSKLGDDALSDILQRNAFEGLAEQRAERLKVMLKDYRTMSGAVRNELIGMGFTITEEGKHYRLTYYGDGRYKATFAKTASDHREGKNMAAGIIRTML